MRSMAVLLSLLSLLGCRSRQAAPAEAGVSAPLSYPVLLIGQSSLDVRDSAEALTSIPGASMLNLNERVIVDTRGRLFDVKRAEPVAGQRSIVWDMGTSRRKFYVEVAERTRATWPDIQALVLEQVNSPRGVWRGDERAIQRVRRMKDVPALIEASRASWRWTQATEDGGR